MTECEFAQISRTLVSISQCCKCKGNQQMRLVCSSWQEIVSTGASLSPGRWRKWRTQQRQQVALSASPWKQSHSRHHCNFVGANEGCSIHHFCSLSYGISYTATNLFVFLCSSIDKPGCWMVVVRLMMVSWSECHRPHVCFLITRNLYERRKIGSEIRFINPQNPGVQFLHISTGKSKNTCILPCFCVCCTKENTSQHQCPSVYKNTTR